MSAIQLSGELFDRIRAAIGDLEPDAARDDGVVMQYLAAVMGYMLGTQDLDRASKEAFLDELLAFARHVYEDADRRMAARRPGGDTGALGYWEPGK